MYTNYSGGIPDGKETGVASIGGVGVYNLGGHLSTKTAAGVTRNVLDDGTGNVQFGAVLGGSAMATQFGYSPPAAITNPVIQTIPDIIATASAACATGTLFLTACTFPAGVPISNLWFDNVTAIAAPTHWWMGVYDGTRNQLAMTADQTTTALTANNLTSLALATGAGGAITSYTPATTIRGYVGIMIAGTTPAIQGAVAIGTARGPQAPILAGASDTAQTTVPAFPHQAGAITSTYQPHLFYGN